VQGCRRRTQWRGSRRWWAVADRACMKARQGAACGGADAGRALRAVAAARRKAGEARAAS
jgi:hypothetical protein